MLLHGRGTSCATMAWDGLFLGLAVSVASSFQGMERDSRPDRMGDGTPMEGRWKPMEGQLSHCLS